MHVLAYPFSLCSFVSSQPSSLAALGLPQEAEGEEGEEHPSQGEEAEHLDLGEGVEVAAFQVDFPVEEER